MVTQAPDTSFCSYPVFRAFHVTGFALQRASNDVYHCLGPSYGKTCDGVGFMWMCLDGGHIKGPGYQHENDPHVKGLLTVIDWQCSPLLDILSMTARTVDASVQLSIISFEEQHAIKIHCECRFW